jgi:hypothetical protein
MSPSLVTRMGVLLLVCVPGPTPVRAEDLPAERFFDVTRNGAPVATLVAPDDEARLWDQAIEVIATTTRRWGGAGPRVVRLKRDAPLPDGDLILLGTPGTHPALDAIGSQAQGPIARVPFVDPHGFAIEARSEGGSRRLIVAGKTPRGAYNGAVYCRDFLLDATAGPAGRSDVFTRAASIVRSPRLAARGVYLLPIYGVAMKYTAEDWMRVIDRFAEDGMERVYFWLSGHHPSKKFPHLYDVDAARGTRLTAEGVRRLIRHCHDRGIRFYIGGGVFAWTASHYLMQGHPEAAAVGASGLCPSRPYARAANREHFLEMYDTWPEADGFMFEVRDEHGECRCGDCQVRLDASGSKAYGRAEITWLEEFAREAWRRNPALRFCWLIGYAEHARDVEYYDRIRQMADPRFEWLDTRVGLDLEGPWRLPGPGGTPHPLAFFGRQISHWDPFYRAPAEAILTAARRSADEGLSGYVPAFEPGFGTGSYYFDRIPLPLDILPYTLTGFVYREATWEPWLTLDRLEGRIHSRFFSPEAPRRLAQDLIDLQRFSFDHWREICLFAKPRVGYLGEEIARLTVDGERRRVRSIADPSQRRAESEKLQQMLAKLAGIAGDIERLNEVESALTEAERQASPKTCEGIAVLRRMIDDTRALYRDAVPDPKLLSAE